MLCGAVALLRCAVDCSSMGVSVGQLLSWKGRADFYRPLRTCGDGVVTAGVEVCDALSSQSPYAGGPEDTVWFKLHRYLLSGL